MGKNIIQRADTNGEFVTLENGFVYFFPSRGGGLTADDLRILSEELDKRNFNWQLQIDNDPAITGRK